MAKSFPKIDAQRKATVDAVLKAMNEKGLRWIQDWQAGALAHNAISGCAYRGINRFHLTFAARVRGYDDPRWCTYRQAVQYGWHVKKGAKSYGVEKWKSYSFTVKDDDDNETTRTGITLVGYYNVFNLCEINGAPEYKLDRPALAASTVTSIADNLIASSRCPVFETSEGRACYSPSRDDIHMPDRRLFVGDNAYRAQAFVRTLAHEMVHSTMLPLHRDTSDVAREELVAEIGSMFCTSDLRIPCVANTTDEHFKQHAAYIQSWSRAIQDKPAALFSAAALADAAAGYICDRYHLMHD